MINNTVTSDFISNILGLGMLSNEATSTDFQIAGGLAANIASGSDTNVGVGGAVAISNLENNLASGIIGGSYENFASIDVEAQKGTTQINGAVAGGKSGYGFNGAFAYGSTKNTTHAYVSDATVGGPLTGALNVKAGEVPVVKTQATLNKENTELADNQKKVDGKEKLTDNSKKRLKESLKEDADDSKKDAKQAADNKSTLEDAGIENPPWTMSRKIPRKAKSRTKPRRTRTNSKACWARTTASPSPPPWPAAWSAMWAPARALPITM